MTASLSIGLDWLGLAPFAEFGFMQRALLGCLALSVSAAPIGVFLMLRRMSLMGDAMAHGILPGAAVGYLVWWWPSDQGWWRAARSCAKTPAWPPSI